MVIKRNIPTWTVVLVIALALGLVGGLIAMNNPSVDRDTIMKLRTKPGSSSPATASMNGMPRGTPISHEVPGPAAGNRQRPAQG